MAGIYKRGKVYHARVQRKGVEYRNSLETTDFGTAKRRFKEWLERLEAASWGERPRISFTEAVRQFILQHCINLKPKSRERYGTSLKQLSDTFEGKYIDEINRKLLGEFESSRRSAGAASPTIRRDLACLSSLLTFCEDREWLDDGFNPVKGFLKRRAKHGGLKEGQPHTRWLTQADEATLLAAASAKRFSKGKLPEAIMLAIDTGLREQELFSLTWPQVDLASNIIHTTRDTKNGRIRAVPFQARSAQFLAQWKKQWEVANPKRKMPSLYVFAKKDGQRYNNHYRGFKLLVEDAKIADTCWHDLRRTAGCRWLQVMKKTMLEVSILLGHSSLKVTEDSYAFLDDLQLAIDTAAHFPAQTKADSQ